MQAAACVCESCDSSKRMLRVAWLPGWRRQLERICGGDSGQSERLPGEVGSRGGNGESVSILGNLEGIGGARGVKKFSPVSAHACILICSGISCLHSKRAPRRQWAEVLAGPRRPHPELSQCILSNTDWAGTLEYMFDCWVNRKRNGEDNLFYRGRRSVFQSVSK